MNLLKPLVFVWWSLWVAVGPLFITDAQQPVAAEPLQTLIVGGGPNRQNNQVAIESNVRYVGSLLPPETERVTLFADGNPQRATVLYDAEPDAVSPARKIIYLLLNEDSYGEPTSAQYRRPNLGAPLDGPAKRSRISEAFTQLSRTATTPPNPVLLYFTGHGSSNDRDNDNNHFDLWDDTNPREAITVRELAQEIARLPEATPVTLVMVQCFSGAFANLIFEEGNPQKDATGRDIAGFFAAIKERMAAGCTSAVNEAEYHDFTSYFFAALTGRDRLGRRVTGADYNKDGRVGMDEAYCYTLAHDASIDVPVCTSDTFLRRFVKTPDREVFATPYTLIKSWATPAQKAAMEMLSQKIHLSGEGRADQAYRELYSNSAGIALGMESYRKAQVFQRFESLRKQGRQSLLARWPNLRRPQSNAYDSEMKAATAEINRQLEAGRWKSLLDAAAALHKTIQSIEADEVNESYRMRFVRLCKSVVLSHHLRETGTKALQDRFERLLTAEGRSLLPPAP